VTRSSGDLYDRPATTALDAAVERVRLGKQSVTEQETASGEVRKEQIDLDTSDVTTTDSTRRRRDKNRN
jgi:hypothetical protein